MQQNLPNTPMNNLTSPKAEKSNMCKKYKKKKTNKTPIMKYSLKIPKLIRTEPVALITSSYKNKIKWYVQNSSFFSKKRV